MNYIILNFLFLSVILSNSVVTIDNVHYTENDFYQEYGKQEWNNAKVEQKKELINDFINRRLAALEAQKLDYKINLKYQKDCMIDIIYHWLI